MEEATDTGYKDCDGKHPRPPRQSTYPQSTHLGVQTTSKASCSLLWSHNTIVCFQKLFAYRDKENSNEKRAMFNIYCYTTGYHFELIFFFWKVNCREHHKVVFGRNCVNLNLAPLFDSCTLHICFCGGIVLSLLVWVYSITWGWEWWRFQHSSACSWLPWASKVFCMVSLYFCKTQHRDLGWECTESYQLVFGRIVMEEKLHIQQILLENWTCIYI